MQLKSNILNKDLVSNNLAKSLLPSKIQWWSGVRPFTSVTLVSTPYCKRSSIIPISAVWQAKWSRENPSRDSSKQFSSSREFITKTLSDGLKQLLLRSNRAEGCSWRSIAFARVNVVAKDVWSYEMLTSPAKVTIWWYTAFLSFLFTLSHNRSATDLCWSDCSLI